MKNLKEPKEALISVKYSPSKEVCAENPPRFTWLPEAEIGQVTYRLEISESQEFPEEKTTVVRDIPYNFTTLNQVLAQGHYFWRYTVEKEQYNYSRVREFELREPAAHTPVPAREERFRNADHSHPRIWMNREQIADFKEKLKKDENYCGFREFYETSVLKYAESSFVKEPERYPGDKRVIPLWRGNYITCQKALEYIRSLCVGGRLLERQDYLEKAKRALLELTTWDVNGATSRDYNDECSFRVAYALAFGYDWLYEELTTEEKESVRSVLLARTRQVADHIQKEAKIQYSLYDSHAVRSLSSVLTPCCIVMLFEEEEAEEWLNYTIDYFSVIYTPWGGNDGGWAEGVMYWGSAMAFLTEALNTLKAYTGIDIYKRPFFQRTGDFQMYCNPAGTYRASFCDQSNLGRMAGHKQAFNIRQFAHETGNANYYRYYEEVFRWMPEIEDAFYNNGWWDFSFDEMVYRYLTQDKKPLLPAPIEEIKWFRDVGWAAYNKNMFDYENHVFFLTKSSPYGSVSHSAGDQNTFVLFAYGEPLVIQSGHYIGFRSFMHLDWRRQTRAHNTLLINGKGQYAGMEREKQFAAKGNICEVKQDGDTVYIREDARESYLENVPDVRLCQREIYILKEDRFLLVDTVVTEEESDVTFLLHSLEKYEISGKSFTVRRPKAVLKGEFVFVSNGIADISQTDEFEGVSQEELEGLEKQWHLKMKTGKGTRHKLVTYLKVEKL